MDQPGETIKTITAMEARKNFGKMLEEVYYKGDIFVIRRAGKSMAVLVPLSMLERWQNNSGAAKQPHETSKRNTRRSHKG